MRIDETRLPTVGPGAVEKAAAEAARKPGAARQQEGQDSVEISSLSEALAAAAAGREERVERLRLQVASGEYNAAAAEVSRKIVDDALKQS